MSESEHPQDPLPTRMEHSGRSEANPGAREGEEASDEDEARFIEGLVVRGEFASASEPLPAGATHESVEQDEDGMPTQVHRRRFSTH